MAARISRVALVTGSGKKQIGWHVADALAGQAHASLHGHFPQSAAAAITPAAISHDQQLTSTPKHAHRRWRGRGGARIGHRLDPLRRHGGGVGGGLLMVMVGLIRQMMAKAS